MLRMELARHKQAYLLLAMEILAFVILFFAAWPNLILQRFLIVFLVGFYILWGVTTHVKSSHFDTQIFWEYVGVALLAGSLLFLITI